MWHVPTSVWPCAVILHKSFSVPFGPFGTLLSRQVQRWCKVVPWLPCLVQGGRLDQMLLGASVSWDLGKCLCLSRQPGSGQWPGAWTGRGCSSDLHHLDRGHGSPPGVKGQQDNSSVSYTFFLVQQKTKDTLYLPQYLQIYQYTEHTELNHPSVTYSHPHPYTLTPSHTHTLTLTHSHPHPYTLTHTHPHTLTHSHTYPHTLIHSHTHTHTLIHSHTHTHTLTHSH